MAELTYESTAIKGRCQGRERDSGSQGRILFQWKVRRADVWSFMRQGSLMRRARLWAPLAAALLAGGGAQAQEAALALGRLHEVGEKEFTYTWRMDYYQRLTPHFAVSLGWLNEGHLENHHRDGWTAQLWATRDPRGQRLRMGVGLGLYRSFDTSVEEGGNGYRNDHNTRPLLSVAMAYPLGDGDLSAQVQLNRTLGGRDPVTQAVLLGLLLRIGPAEPAAPSPPARQAGEGRQEVLFYYGQTILNSDTSQTADAYEIAYRRRISPHWSWSAGYVNEGSPEKVRRDGVSLQAWLDGFFLERRLRLGMGVGPYATRVEHYEGGPDRDDVRLSGRVTLAAGWRLAPQWMAHFTWNRTATSYHRDTDVLAAGLGFDW